MSLATAFRRCLMALDIRAVRAIWRESRPGLPQPETDAETLATIHVARTKMDSLPDALRCYSHAWLRERGLPSRLPDRLKAKADRLYPRRVEAVGVIVRTAHPDIERAIGGAMLYAVDDCFANGDTATEIVKPQMMRARFRERRALGLRRRDDIPTEWRP